MIREKILIKKLEEIANRCEKVDYRGKIDGRVKRFMDTLKMAEINSTNVIDQVNYFSSKNSKQNREKSMM